MPTDIVERFAKRLKKIRKDKNITQILLSEKAGIETTYLSDLENAKKEPCLRVIDTLATGLGVSMSELFRNI